jgi:hypothetical protein
MTDRWIVLVGRELDKRFRFRPTCACERLEKLQAPAAGIFKLLTLQPFNTLGNKIPFEIIELGQLLENFQ